MGASAAATYKETDNRGYLTAQESEEIMRVLNEAEKVITPKNIKLPDEANRAISMAARYCDVSDPYQKQVRDKAVMLATDSTWRHFRKEAQNYLVSGKFDMVDMYQEFSIIVFTTLPNYNPEKGSLITYLNPLVKIAFADTRLSGNGAKMTKHYQDAGALVGRATQELRKLGNINPSVEDICEYINGTGKKHVSEVTIRRYQDQNFYTVAFSPDMDMKKGSSYGNPLDPIIKKEEEEMFNEAKNMLPDMYKAIIDMEIEHIDATGERPDSDLILAMLKEEFDSTLQEKDIKRIITSAHQQFARHITRKEKPQRARPVNNMIRIADDASEDEKNDIIAAIEEDITIIE